MQEINPLVLNLKRTFASQLKSERHSLQSLAELQDIQAARDVYPIASSHLIPDVDAFKEALRLQVRANISWSARHTNCSHAYSAGQCCSFLYTSSFKKSLIDSQMKDTKGLNYYSVLGHSVSLYLKTRPRSPRS